MELVVTLLIVSLFGIWIYNLKQELQDLHKNLPHAREHEGHAIHSVAPEAIKAPSREGVQTWVLE